MLLKQKAKKKSDQNDIEIIYLLNKFHLKFYLNYYFHRFEVGIQAKQGSVRISITDEILCCSLLYEPVDFYLPCEELMGSENGGLAVARGWNVVEIDPYEKRAYLENGKAIRYGNCLIATGKI